MSNFALRKIEIKGAVHQFYEIVKDDKCLYSKFLIDARKKFHIKEDSQLKFKEGFDEVEELETLIEDIALDNTVLPRCHKPLKSISKQINYQAHEIRTTSSMLRVYYIKEKNTGKIILLGHIKSNEKDQKKELKRVIKISKEYHNYQLRNEVKIVK